MDVPFSFYSLISFFFLLYEHWNLGEDAQVRLGGHSDWDVSCAIRLKVQCLVQRRERSQGLNADPLVVDQSEMIDEILPAGLLLARASPDYAKDLNPSEILAPGKSRSPLI